MHYVQTTKRQFRAHNTLVNPNTCRYCFVCVVCRTQESKLHKIVSCEAECVCGLWSKIDARHKTKYTFSCMFTFECDSHHHHPRLNVCACAFCLALALCGHHWCHVHIHIDYRAARKHATLNIYSHYSIFSSLHLLLLPLHYYNTNSSHIIQYKIIICAVSLLSSRRIAIR